jgi:hypothetical protein
MSDITRASAKAGNARIDGLANEMAMSAPSGGARRDRTDDLLLAKQALSQLSYGPLRDGQQGSEISSKRILTPDTWLLELVGLGRFELPTSRLSSARSNQLSYKPEPGINSQESVIGTGATHLIPDSANWSLMARSRRKRNEDGGVPPVGSSIRKPIGPDVSKRSDKDA